MESVVLLSPLRANLRYKAAALLSSILFGIMHISNWIDFALLTDEKAESWADKETHVFVENAVSRGILHAVSSFCVAWFILTPVYYRHGIFAAIAAHAAINAFGLCVLPSAEEMEEFLNQ